MKDVYPEFADRVAFIAVGQDPTESLELLEKTRKQRDYPWPVAEPDRNLLLKLRVLQESTKIALDARGVIIYRRQGSGDKEEWTEVFRELAASAVQ